MVPLRCRAFSPINCDGPRTIIRRQVSRLSLTMPQAVAQLPLDFRSPQFVDSAQALQRLTGCPLAQCRQELFIAEGDAVEAWQVLVGDPAAGMLPVLAH